MLKIHEISDLENGDYIKVRDSLGNDFHGIVVRKDKVSQWIELICYQHKEYDIRRRVFWYGVSDRELKVTKCVKEGLDDSETSIFSDLGNQKQKLDKAWGLYFNKEISHNQLEDYERQLKDLEETYSEQLKETNYKEMNNTRKVFDKLYLKLDKDYTILKSNQYRYEIEGNEGIKVTYDIRNGTIELEYNLCEQNEHKLMVTGIQGKEDKLKFRQGIGVNNGGWTELKVEEDTVILSKNEIGIIVDSIKLKIDECINIKVNEDKKVI